MSPGSSYFLGVLRRSAWLYIVVPGFLTIIWWKLHDSSQSASIVSIYLMHAIATVSIGLPTTAIHCLVLKPHNIEMQPLSTRFVAYASATVIGVLIGTEITTWALSFPPWRFPPANTRDNMIWIGFGASIFFSGAVTAMENHFHQRVEMEARHQEAQHLATLSELRALRSRINPHFLFNSLNSLAELMVTDPERAEIALLKLSKYLRMALEVTSHEKISLAEEISAVSDYLAIERIRFGDRMDCHLQIDESCNAYLVPSFVLQPLLENAVHHGVAISQNPCQIRVIAEDKDNQLRIIVENSRTKRRSIRGAGTALSDLQKRLQLLYGNAAKLIITEFSSTFQVELSLPAVHSPPRLER